MKPTYFKTADQFRAWLVKNHDKADELFIGMYRKGTGKIGITYKEAVDEALCFGWIDGIARRVDEVSFQQRFTPRRPKSIWSAVNIANVERLRKAGKLHESGERVFASRDPARANLYSFEQKKPPELTPEFVATFRKNKKAWAFWEKQPPGYRKAASWLVISAKQQATQDRRLAQLINLSARGERLPRLVSPLKRKKKPV